MSMSVSGASRHPYVPPAAPSPAVSAAASAAKPTASAPSAATTAALVGGGVSVGPGVMSFLTQVSSPPAAAASSSATYQSHVQGASDGDSGPGSGGGHTLPGPSSLPKPGGA